MKMLLDKDNIPAVPAAMPNQELTGQMIVFAGLNEKSLNGLLALLRANPECGQIPYKAVLTDTNKEWNAYMLMEELKKEHAAMRP